MFFEVFFAIWLIGSIFAWSFVSELNGEDKLSIGYRLLAALESWLFLGSILGKFAKEINDHNEKLSHTRGSQVGKSRLDVLEGVPQRWN